MDKNVKGVSILESLVCLVIIGIGFVAMLQLSSFSINVADRTIEKNKINFLSEMVVEDMLGDYNNRSSYGGFNESNSYYSNQGGSELHKKNKDKWRNKLNEKNYIKYDTGSGYKDKKPKCYSGDTKQTFFKDGSARLKFKTGKGKRKKYLGVLIK